VPQVGGEEREHSLDVESGLVPVDEGPNGEGMTKLVDPRPVRLPVPEADTIDEALEGVADVLIDQSRVVQRNEERDRRGDREPPPTFFGVFSERRDGGRVKRDLPRNVSMTLRQPS